MKGLRRLILVAAATAGLALSLTGCSKTVDRASVFDADQNEVAFARTNIGESRWLNTGLEAFKKNEVDRYSNEYDIYEFPVNWQ